MDVENAVEIQDTTEDEGEAKDDDFPEKPIECEEGTVCYFGGECRPAGGIGDWCYVHDDLCKEELLCDECNEICGFGECYNNWDCEGTDTFCSWYGKCEVESAGWLGDSCSDDNSCQHSLWCNQGLCWDRQCDEATPCNNGECVFGECEVMGNQPGSPCYGEYECFNGLECNEEVAECWYKQ